VRKIILVFLLLGLPYLALGQTPDSMGIATTGQSQEPSGTVSPDIVIPAETHVQLKLTNPMRARATHKGDSVRAVTAFPVTVGNQLAIPSGTYVDGVIDQMIKRGPSGHAQLQIHFTRLVFANGYSVLLDSATALAKNEGSGGDAPQSQRTASATPVAFAQGFQQPPPNPMPPPLPQVGPSKGEVIGLGLGVTAAATLAVILMAHNRSGDVLLDSGYQFEMVLGTSLALDSDRVAAAVAYSSAR
jgi:hypothetical protein